MLSRLPACSAPWRSSRPRPSGAGKESRITYSIIYGTARRAFPRNFDLSLFICFLFIRFFVAVVPQSKIRGKFWPVNFKRLAINVAKFCRNFSQIFVLQFPGNMAARNFTQIPPHMRTSNSTGREPKFFHCDTLGVGGPKFFFSFFSHVFLVEKPALKTPKPALKKEKRDQKDHDRHFRAQAGT